MQESVNKKLMAAHKYREMGFNVIPTREDKKPHISWLEYQNRKVVAGELDDFWKSYPDANPAIITGPISNLTVLDIDTKDGMEAFNEFDDGKAPVVDTPNGGIHVYYSCDPEIGTGARKANDWDWRGPKGYVLAPPSTINGKTYAWRESRHILNTPPTKINDILKAVAIQSDLVHSNSNTLVKSGVTPEQQYNNPITHGNKGNTIRVGQRDQTLFHLANVLVRGGMPEDNILYFLKMFWRNCCEEGGDKYSESELKTKILSALNRHQTITMGEVEELVRQQFGYFDSTIVKRELQVSQPKDGKKVNTYLSRMCERGIIERHSERSGVYRLVEKEIEPEDWINASTETCDINLPFGLGDMVHLMPGDIILFSGVPGVGKTAVLLNAAIDNISNYNVHYFSSELRPGTFKRRVSKLDHTTPEMLKDIKFYQRYENYHDVIKSGRGNLNVIDYVKVLDNFYIIGKILANIAKKLDGAIAIVSLQKQYGSKTGLGGMFSQFEPVLSVNLDRGEDHSVATISKTKEYKEEYIEKYGTADGYQYHFKIINGIKLLKVRYWHKPVDF
jgi:hypothetical protein